MGSKRQEETALLIGNFNCPHFQVATFVGIHHFTLLNDTTHFTGRGTAREADTSLGLVWILGSLLAIWENTAETVGRDHQILEIRLTIGKLPRPPKGSRNAISITKWHQAQTKLEDTDTSHLRTDEWSSHIVNTINKHTRPITRTKDHPQVDQHFLTL